MPKKAKKGPKSKHLRQKTWQGQVAAEIKDAYEAMNGDGEMADSIAPDGGAQNEGALEDETVEAVEDQRLLWAPTVESVLEFVSKHLFVQPSKMDTRLYCNLHEGTTGFLVETFHGRIFLFGHPEVRRAVGIHIDREHRAWRGWKLDRSALDDTGIDPDELKEVRSHALKCSALVHSRTAAESEYVLETAEEYARWIATGKGPGR